jgi:hypothetical protein
MKIKFTPFLLLIPLLLFFQSCHDIELVRIAAVETGSAEVDNSSVALSGAIIDAGEPGDMIGYGFVYGTSSTPTSADQKVVTGSSSEVGAYQSTISNLTPGTWYFRAFVNSSDNGYAYGNVMTFTITQESPQEQEVFYGNGIQNSYLGFDFPGSYMALIYVEQASLQAYDGYRIVSMKFFPGSVNPESFTIHLEQSTYYEQDVASPVAGTWNEVHLNQPFFIDANVDLFAGYWIHNQAFNSSPCGVDAGPAYNGFGDLLFHDGTIYTSGYNVNWCIKLKLESMKGEQIEISMDAASQPPIDKDKQMISRAPKGVLPLIHSQSKNANQ